MAEMNGNESVLPAELDAVVVGAGFGGMYMLHKLRELGMTSVVFEAAPDVGGTSYWNAYTGARCDIESLMYNYSFDYQVAPGHFGSENYADFRLEKARIAQPV